MNMLQKTLLSLAASALTIGAAQAADVGFTGTFDAGLRFGQTFNGTFSYNESTPHGADDSLALTGLSFSFGGKAYSRADALAGSAFVNFGSGAVIGFDAVLASAGTTLTFSTGFGSPFLAYETPTDFGGGSYSLTSAVPEPSTWLMSLGGLTLLMAFAVRRRKS